jgi:cytochrome c2
MKTLRLPSILLALLLVLSLGLAACGGDDDEDNDNDNDNTSEVGAVVTEAVNEVEEAATEVAAGADATEGNEANGETLFTGQGCVGCHAVDSDATMTGPSLQNVASVAGTRVDGMSAEEYLHQSLVDPGAHVVEGFENVMPSYSQLPESDLNDLVAYLMTLNEG